MFSKIFIIYIFLCFLVQTTSLLIPHLFKNKRLRLRIVYKKYKTHTKKKKKIQICINTRQDKRRNISNRLSIYVAAAAAALYI